MTDAAAPRLTTLQTLIAFLERKALVMLALGFAAGLPNLLIFDTLSTWLRDGYTDVTLEVIAWFSLATLAYSLKFLWAPLVDRTSIPGLTALLGHRRSWMLVAQGFIIAGLVLVSLSDPGRNLGRTLLRILAAELLGFILAGDALQRRRSLRTEVLLQQSERGLPVIGLGCDGCAPGGSCTSNS